MPVATTVLHMCASVAQPDGVAQFEAPHSLRVTPTWQMDAWSDDDDNLTKWEDNSLTASDRRILLATWYFRACKRALQGEAKRKYFEHAGALLTADGTDDDLIKFEGAPAGDKVKL